MKTNIAATLTAAILEKLEAGTKPWVQPWTGAPCSRPLRHCGTAYRGINTVMLWMAAQAHGYSSPYWMTYRQADFLEGQVRKGEKCSHAVLYKTIGAKDVKPGDEPIESEDGSRTRRILRAFAVFNADQIDGLPPRYYRSDTHVDRVPVTIHHPQLEAFFQQIPAIVRHNGYRAYYNHNRDEIVLPPIERFAAYEGYFAIRAHETAHWTGHKKRLDRQFGARFGDNAYAFEELVADIAAAILGAALGLPEAILENHAAYVGHWVNILKSDKTAVLTAASKADEAVNFILGFAQPGISKIIEREPQLLAHL